MVFHSDHYCNYWNTFTPPNCAHIHCFIFVNIRYTLMNIFWEFIILHLEIYWHTSAFIFDGNLPDCCSASICSKVKVNFGLWMGKFSLYIIPPTSTYDIISANIIILSDLLTSIVRDSGSPLAKKCISNSGNTKEKQSLLAENLLYCYGAFCGNKLEALFSEHPL